ncbi:MAG: porin [Burkholderiaceae bacterium]|nr:porin [Burkholderiaceae bacterium]
MKKSLIAVAVAAALPAAAFAQTSVTLYGVADLSLSKANQGGKTQMSGNGLLNNGNGRIGVRGTEDLGGGLKASFNYEQGINGESGATDATTFQRQANMSLSGKFGALKMGRALTPSFYGVAAYELTGAANYTALGNMFGWAGSGARNNSQWAYTTPTMGGFEATLGYITDADNGGNNKVDANAIYRGGPLVVGLSYNKVQGAADAGWALGGKYAFGMVTVAASYQDPSDARKGFTLGGSAKLGPMQLTIDAARDTGDPSNYAKSTDYIVELLYPLSKRTTVYAAAHRDGSTKTNTTGLGVRHNF